jgi:AraC-binding-like domain
MYDADRTTSFADMQAMICRDYSMIRSDWSADDRVRARLTFRRLDDLGVGDMSIHVSRAWLSRRGATEIRIDPRPSYLLMMMSDGHARFTQGAHDWHLSAGDLVLWDQSCPFDLYCEPRIRAICVTIPYESRLASEVALGRSVGLRASGSAPFGAFAGTMVRQLVDLDLAGVDLEHDVARSALTTIAVAFGNASVATTGPSDAAYRDLRRRIKAWLLANLHERDIDVDAVGAAHGVSGRTVH